MALRPAVFLDRDGTLHRELERAPRTLAELEFVPGLDAALRELASSGYVLVVVTNQSAVASGDVSVAELDALGRALRERFPIAACYVCPHHPERGAPPYVRSCTCRKPSSGMLALACADLGLDPARSWIVGDARRDLEAGLALGTRAILVRTGKGQREQASLPTELAARVTVVDDVVAATRAVLAQGK